jgi:hypothetical protein
MKLFQIYDRHTNKALEGAFFDSKPSAKQHRAELNEQSGETARYIVIPGPDHWRYAQR